MTSSRNIKKTQSIVNTSPPETLFILGAVSQYVGAAIAFNLFDTLGVSTVAILRVLGAAIVTILIRRSWKRSIPRGDLVWVAAFGVVLAGMNLCFYLAIDNLPLGNAVAIEFLGPIVIAFSGQRSFRSTCSLLLASIGVALLAEVSPEGSATGVVFALAAGSLWALYILLGSHVARSNAHMDGLGIGMMIGAIVISPAGLDGLQEVGSEPVLALVALSTGILSSAIPYSIDQVVFRRVSRFRFAFLQALLPATAVLVGTITLRQQPSLLELSGIFLVIIAILLRKQRAEG